MAHCPEFGSVKLNAKLCLAGWLAGSCLAALPGTAQEAKGVAYTLLQGSYLIDDCPICGRPTIEEPLRGTFELVLLQNTAPYTKYAMRNIDFVAGAGSTL